MYKLIKSILFQFSAETAHNLTMTLLKLGMNIPGIKALVSSQYSLRSVKLNREVFGIRFPNPVGLAAGFDKNAHYLHELKTFGFGFIEIGTVTPKGQPGNEQPRLFRLKDDEALINRMGFNNEGVDLCIERLKRRPKNLIVGGNIGKNKITPNEEAINDYLICFEKLFPYVDYFVVNVSSPNTPNLRALQDKEPLTDLLRNVQEANDKKETRKPVLLKIAPDLTNEQVEEIVEIVNDTKIDGIIATNTTIDRSNLNTSQSKVDEIGNGGLSGKPVRKKSTEIISLIKSKAPELPVVGVGGVSDGESALEKLNAGADLVQIYTGFIYTGPSIVKRINKALIDSFEQD